MKEFIAHISRIGILPGDNDNTVLKKQFMIYQGLAMSGGGLVWGALCLFFDFTVQSVIPFGYVTITVINFYFLSITKSFSISRNIQTFISLLLPFLLQWLLGGFSVSGGVMLWSVLALTTSVTYQNTKTSLFWLVAFIALVLLSLIFDSYFAQRFITDIPSSASLLFLVVNVLCISTIVFALFLYFTIMNTNNMEKLKQSYIKLVHSEKLAALGQVAAGVAHEVNTPLGAIKSSAEESSVAFMEIMSTFIWLSSNLDEKTKDLYIEFIGSSAPSMITLSTKEEREKKKYLREKLESIGVENARFLSDRLVQVGIYEVSPQMEKLAGIPEFERLVMLTYNILNQQRSNQTIQMAVNKASRIVKALKTYLHTSGSEEAEAVNLRDNIETVLTIYHNRLKQGINVIKNYEDVPNVFAHPDQLNQVWTNLIVNAVQAMDNKGLLTIGIKPDGDYVTVSIKDTGKGIPKEIQEKIFDPFFTTKVSGEGTGLGLDIIKRILDDHNGKISLESVVGEGTTFYVKLPVKK